MFLFLFLFPLSVTAWAANPPSSAPPESEYEIDYEEEPGAAQETPTPAALPPSPPKGRKPLARGSAAGSAVQGSRAKNRFVPFLKSETRSVYQKDGKPLDVDSD